MDLTAGAMQTLYELHLNSLLVSVIRIAGVPVKI